MAYMISILPHLTRRNLAMHLSMLQRIYLMLDSTHCHHLVVGSCGLSYRIKLTSPNIESLVSYSGRLASSLKLHGRGICTINWKFSILVWNPEIACLFYGIHHYIIMWVQRLQIYYDHKHAFLLQRLLRQIVKLRIIWITIHNTTHIHTIYTYY